MKNLSISPLALCLLLLILGCQLDTVAPHQLNLDPIDDKVPSLPSTGIPPDEIIRTDYTGAIKWRITFNSVNTDHLWTYQRFFSTIDGSLYSLADLNSSEEVTALVDFNLMFWYISSLVWYNTSLSFPNHASDTRLKPAEFNAQQLAVMTAYYPINFQQEFEYSSFSDTSFQPYNYDSHSDEFTYVQKGDIFLFKTGRSPARFGAIHIIEKANPFLGTEQSTIEITVQSDNHISNLKN